MRSFLLVAFLTVSVHAEVVEFNSGRWLERDRFEHGTRYSVDGVLTRKRPTHVDRRISLDGRFVIPPLAEAHNHWLEPDAIAEYNQRYLADGVFYVMDQANVPFIAQRNRTALNRPLTVDYTAAVLGFTGAGGHPTQIIEQFVTFGIMPPAWKVNPDRNAILVVSSEADIADRWPLLRVAGTDHVKLFLLYSEEYERRKNDSSFGHDRGLDPALVPSIVDRAHRDGLRVAAHVYSASDFRTAVAAKVDLIAHMPGTGAGEHPDDLARYRISEGDAALAARNRVQVITTLSWLDELREDAADLADRIEREVIVPNLRLLKKHGVPILIGSDTFRGTPTAELFILARLHLYSNREIVRLATSDTPRAIFPKRNLGSLEDGFEASFLVLDGDPLQNLAAVRGILLRVKRGVIMPMSSPIP